MRYYIIAGEASGDLHGSNLIKQLKLQDSSAEIRCWGGDLMQAAGGNVVKHFRDLAFMGFVEVLMNLKTILKNLKWCKQDIEAFQPDALILIDYPGFNLRIAKWAKQKGIKVIYYIAPQVWAWKENRVPSMKQSIDQMLVILPFEKDYFKNKWNWEVEYVGHPLVEVVDAPRAIPRSTRPDKPIIALLPGSRKQEIRKKLPVMLSVVQHFPDYQFIIAKAPGLDESFYDEFIKGYHSVETVTGKTYEILSQAKAALVTSGTATLETALMGIPEVVCYKGNPISYSIAKRLIKVKYISLVNLIMDRLIVTELIQHDLTEENLIKELDALLNNPDKIHQLKSDYAELKSKLQAGGNASQQAAQKIIQFLNA